MRRARVAIRFAALLASAQFEAVAVPNANKGKPGLMLPGMVSSASARQVQVHPRFGQSGGGIFRLGAGFGSGCCMSPAPGVGSPASIGFNRSKTAAQIRGNRAQKAGFGLPIGSGSGTSTGPGGVGSTGPGSGSGLGLACSPKGSVNSAGLFST